MLGDEFILEKLSSVTGANVEGLRLVLSILSGMLTILALDYLN